MSIGQGQLTTGSGSTPTPGQYSPVSPPQAVGPVGQIQQQLSANASPATIGNPFVLGGRGFGQYSDPTQAPPSQGMSVPAPKSLPNGGFPAVPATGVPAQASPAVMGSNAVIKPFFGRSAASIRGMYV